VKPGLTTLGHQPFTKVAKPFQRELSAQGLLNDLTPAEDFDRRQQGEVAIQMKVELVHRLQARHLEKEEAREKVAGRLTPQDMVW
jgi:hypothetical protein